RNGAAITQPEFAVALLDKGIVAGRGRARRRPGPALFAGIAQRRIQRTLGVAQVELGEDQLRQAGTQRGAWAGADRAEQLAAVDEYLLELHRAAVGLALAEAVPVLVDHQAFTLARQHDEHPIFGIAAPRRADHQGIGTQGTRAERLAAVELVVILAPAQRQAGVAAVGGVAPEPTLLHGAGQPVTLL